jgi:hypothetical protein
MLLFNLAVFLLLSGRSAGTNSLQKAYSLPKGSPPQVSLLFWAHYPSQNNRKIHKNVSNQPFKMCGSKLSDTSVADFIQKKSLKLFARVKMYVQVTNVHALVRGLQNRTLQTSMRSCAVRNE